MTLNFHKQFEELSKLPVNETDTLDDVLFRLGQRLCACMKLERVNIWVFKHNPSRLECIANYLATDDSFSKGEILMESQIPTYFSHLMSDRVILIKNVYTNEISAELKDSYCVDHHVMSIMDIPVRIEGRLAGVICFEDCKQEREWTEDEVNFAMAVSQIVSLSIENYKRRHYETKLKKALEEKNTLLVEMHHRIKNNLTMLISLLRIQSRTINDPEDLEIFSSFEHQILSISKLHEQLYVTGNYLKVDLKSYLSELSSGLNEAMIKPVQFQLELDQVFVKSNTAVTIGLIVNEIISNSLKHGLKLDRDMTVGLRLEKQNGQLYLKLSDDGEGFNMPQEINSSFGLSLIHDLSEQIGADITFTSDSNGTTYELRMEN